MTSENLPADVTVSFDFFKPNDSLAAVFGDCARGKRHSRKHTKKNILPHCLPFKSGRKMPSKTHKKSSFYFSDRICCHVILQHNFATSGLGLPQNWRFFPAKNSQKSEPTANFETRPNCQSPQSQMLDGEKKLGRAACWFISFCCIIL